MVRNARVLLFGLAKTGIDGLIDETTGYQEIRERDALQKILNRYLVDERRPWSKTFPYEFFKLLFELKEWDLDPASQRPGVIGHYINDLVYRRQSPTVLAELRRRNPVIPATGRRRHKHHQWFNPEYGHPDLVRHIDRVIMLMDGCATWDEFMYEMDRFLPSPDDTPMFGFSYNRKVRKDA